MKKNGRTLSEDIRLIKRGMREFGVFLPGQLRLLLIHSAVTMAVPYIGVFMASAVISELGSRRRVPVLAAAVICAAVSTLVLTVIAAVIGRKISVGYSQLFPAHEIRLNEKANAMKYSFVEDERIRALRDQVSGSIDCSGAGMGSLYWDCESVFKAVISALISAAILISRAGSGRAGGSPPGSALRFAGSAWGCLILALAIAVSVIVSSRATSRIFDVSFDVFKRGAEYNRYANYYKLEYLSDDRTAQDVRLYSQKDLILRELLDKCYIPFARGDRREKAASSRNQSVMLALGALTGGLVYIFVGARAMAGGIGTGDVLLVYSAVAMLIKALTDLSMTFTDLRNNNEHLIRYFEYISLEEEEPRTRASAAAAKNTEVRLDRVSFRYPGSGVYALRDISLDIGAGEKIAIVGENGSGKTTLVKLICSLYDADDGEIRIGGAAVSGTGGGAGRDMLSVVFQDIGLLALPIGNNIAAGDTYDEARVWDALEKVGLREKVMSFPMKLEQPLFKDYDGNGAELSGGEEQKLAIARGIYRDAPLFILDEPTAALDPISEYEIFTRMNELARDKTTIFISHRLYSCRFCDRIVVMDGGRIVQTGTHERLLSEPGRYSELWNAQAKHYGG